MAPTISTLRLRLRPWRDEDLDPFAALNADPRVREHFPNLLTRSESDAQATAMRAHLAAHEFGFWAVEVPDVTPFAGIVGLSPVGFEAPFTPCIEVGWRLAHEHWGRGYATEAATAVLAHAFGPLGLAEVVSFTVPGNHRSRRVMEHLGMRHSPGDDFQHPGVPQSHPLRPHVLYRLRSADWGERR
jgi:ribosomal-protein-alanine N-acetyltransferase